FQMKGKAVSIIEDTPGMIIMRTVSMLINEAHEALLHGIASKEGIETGAVLGLNFPIGPFAWEARLGAGTVLAVLDNMLAFTGDTRYRASQSLRQAVL